MRLSNSSPHAVVERDHSPQSRETLFTRSTFDGRPSPPHWADMSNSLSKCSQLPTGFPALLAWEILLARCCQFLGNVGNPLFGLPPGEHRQALLNLASTHANRQHGRLMAIAHTWARLLKGLRERVFWRTLERFS